MADIIVYTLVQNGGGIDGMDFTDKGGKISSCHETRQAAEADRNAPWCKIVPIVVDTVEAKRKALAKLDALDKFILKVK